MWVKYQASNPVSAQEGEEDYLLPLKTVAIQGTLEGPLATLNIDMTYVNENQKDAIECTYEFPMVKDTVLGSLVAKIDDKEIVAKVKGKDQARETYEDAIAAGNTAVYAEQKTEDQEIIKIKLGNLLPLKEAKLSLQLIFTVPVESGAYKFTLPVDFYPDY